MKCFNCGYEGFDPAQGERSKARVADKLRELGEKPEDAEYVHICPRCQSFIVEEKDGSLRPATAQEVAEFQADPAGATAKSLSEAGIPAAVFEHKEGKP